ncbi:hypothetical protein Belba_2852 [Belliella baltica DSM 15883]|uniref:Uncharacterized protein n=1 Tax=Belliella baltica (strain DSM 15883 / CIP 108006 / LMG 21964 / BA134) TaxID=866536 RepID=I3Z816_BELBD|nr:hypothetical protein Belba_2852 [Belliella baltica DSM 15883]
MNSVALIMLVVTQGLVISATLYFLIKVLRTPEK